MFVQAAFSVVLMAMFLVAAGYNGLIFLGRRHGDSGPSVIPIVGGVLGGVGVWLWPYYDLGLWAWAPVLLDYGCGYYLAVGTLLEIRRAWRYREGACFARLAGESGEKTVEIRLYRGGRLQLSQTFKNRQNFGSFSSGGAWTAVESGHSYALSVWGASIVIEARDASWTVAQESSWFHPDLRLSPITLAVVAGRA